MALDSLQSLRCVSMWQSPASAMGRNRSSGTVSLLGLEAGIAFWIWLLCAMSYYLHPLTKNPPCSPPKLLSFSAPGAMFGDVAKDRVLK